VGRQIPLEEMEQFFRFMWAGFWVNAISGVLLFTTEATTKGIANIFLIKLSLIAVGVTLIVLLRRIVYNRARRRATVNVPATAFPALSLLVWMAAITAGRL